MVPLECVLEEVLVQRPEMLEAGLHVVRRQTAHRRRPLDAGGRLIVFELKREKLTGEAVTQCIDYAAALKTLTLDELASFMWPVCTAA